MSSVFRSSIIQREPRTERETLFFFELTTGEL